MSEEYTRSQAKPTISVSSYVYNCIVNDEAVLSRAVQLLLEQMGVVELQIGNVYVYQSMDGASGWFVDENGKRLQNVDYAFVEESEG